MTLRSNLLLLALVAIFVQGQVQAELATCMVDDDCDIGCCGPNAPEVEDDVETAKTAKTATSGESSAESGGSTAESGASSGKSDKSGGSSGKSGKSGGSTAESGASSGKSGKSRRNAESEGMSVESAGDSAVSAGNSVKSAGMSAESAGNSGISGSSATSSLFTGFCSMDACNNVQPPPPPPSPAPTPSPTTSSPSPAPTTPDPCIGLSNDDIETCIVFGAQVDMCNPTNEFYTFFETSCSLYCCRKSESKSETVILTPGEDSVNLILDNGSPDPESGNDQTTNTDSENTVLTADESKSSNLGASNPGATSGLVVGILFGVAVVFGLSLYVVKQRKETATEKRTLQNPVYDGCVNPVFTEKALYDDPNLYDSREENVSEGLYDAHYVAPQTNKEPETLYETVSDSSSL